MARGPAVAGHAVAGGLELALWCDLRVAEESAVFGVFCRRWGVPLMDGGTVRLPRLIGASQAMDMVLCPVTTGAWEKMSVEEAVAILGRAGVEKYGFITKQQQQEWPSTWAFKTREGGVGILQLLDNAKSPETLTIRYKLVR